MITIIDVTEIRKPRLVYSGSMYNEDYEVYDTGLVRITTHWDNEDDIFSYKYANIDEAMYELGRRYY